MIKNDLNNLKEADLYSLILFSLYKLIPTPEYSSISQLAYVLDKENLLNLCKYFGGQVIRIPTVDELENLILALTLYQHVNLEHQDFERSFESIKTRSENAGEVKKLYKNLVQVLDEYEFKSL